jgi:hypothetical protein
MQAKHLKSGNIYDILATDCIDCTNGQENKEMVIYSREDILFVREKKEFFEKFEVIENNNYLERDFSSEFESNVQIESNKDIDIVDSSDVVEKDEKGN